MCFLTVWEPKIYLNVGKHMSSFMLERAEKKALSYVDQLILHQAKTNISYKHQISNRAKQAPTINHQCLNFIPMAQIDKETSSSFLESASL